MERLSGSLLHWLRTFKIEGVHGSVEELCNGVAIGKVLHHIDSEFFDESWLSKIKTDAGSNWRLKVSNLKKVYKGILDYYNEILGQQTNGFRMLNINSLGEHNDVEELGRLLQLVLGCAVNCDRKHEYIEALMGLEEKIQHDVMNAIQELMTKETPPTDASSSSENISDLNSQVKGLTEALNSEKESKEQITQRCHELDAQVTVLLNEKSILVSENEKLLEKMNHIESFEDPSTVAGKRFQQLQQKLEIMQDEIYKMETGKDELKLKNDSLRKEIFDLQQKNEDLQKLAEESQSMKDELDVLRHTSDKVNVYEATIESYKKKLEDMSALKRQVKLLEEKSTFYMQQNIELEEVIKKTSTMKDQIDMYKKQARELQEKLTDAIKRADKSEFENKRAQEKFTSVQTEKDRLVIERDSLKESLEELRCTQFQKDCAREDGQTSIGDSELLDAIPLGIKEKLIRLQHENKMLKLNAGSLAENELTLVKSSLDDARSRINELETDNRLANCKIMELESQIEDIQTNQTAASIHEDFKLKQKLNSAMKRQKDVDAEIHGYSVTIESLESQIEASVANNQQLQDLLNQKDEDMKAMEERYRKYLEKAKNVIKNLDPKKNNFSNIDAAVRTQLLEKDKIIANLEKEVQRITSLFEGESKLMTTVVYNLGGQLQRRVAEERLSQSAIPNSTFLAMQRQARCSNK